MTAERKRAVPDVL